METKPVFQNIVERSLPCLTAILLITGAGRANSAPPTSRPPPAISAPSRLTTLRPQISRITLASPYDTVRLLVDGQDSDGSLHDVSAQATFYSDNPRVVIVTDKGVAEWRGPGQAIVTATVKAAGTTRTCRIPVTAGAIRTAKTNAPRFLTDVMPILTKAGCNMGACHGANAGRGGFHLSLLGYEPAGDYLALTRFVGARRISPAQPDNSLILRKATARMPHGGGPRFDPDSAAYRTLRDWIAAGAPRRDGEGTGAESHVTRLVVTPVVRTLQAGETQRLRVEAVYADDTRRDVTSRTVFTSGDGAILDVRPDGTARVVGPGEGAVVIRYSGVFTTARIVAPFGPSRPVVPAASPIDRLVNAKVGALGLAPSPRCSDSEFLRRATLDVTGRLPTPDVSRAWIADTNPRKREEMVDTLLASPAYVDFWTLKWGDLFRNSKRSLGVKGMTAYHGWIRDCVAKNRGWDAMARDVLLAQGSVTQQGAGNFFRTGINPDERQILPPEDLGEATAQVYLGVRLQCAHCHNHPFEKWTQNQYFQLASFFGRLEARPGKDKDDKIIAVTGQGEVRHPRTNAVMTPIPLDGPALPTDYKGDRRQALADWLTAPSNPFFAPVIVNRVWKHYMGRGLVEPVDDFRVTNPATNDPLLAYLVDDLHRQKYDLKALMREILLSDAYQRASQATPINRRDNRYYSRFLVKRLSAEALLDAINDVTGAKEAFADYAPGTRATQLMDSSVGSFFLDAFGRPPRQTACECERSSEIGVTQTLHLINSPAFADKLAAPTGRLAALCQSTPDSRALIEELFLTALSRLPTDAERARSLKYLAQAKDRQQAAQDLLWAILNTTEFVFNH